LLTMFAVTLLGDRVCKAIIGSRSGRYIATVLDRSHSVIPPEIHEVVEPYLQRFDQKFHGEEEQGWTGWMTSGRSEQQQGSVPYQQYQQPSQQRYVPAGQQQWGQPQQAQQLPGWNGFQR